MRGRSRRVSGAALLAAFAALWSASTAVRADADAFPGIATAYLVRVNGETPWSRNSARPLAPASLTKLMTALLVDEADQPDSIVTITAPAAAATGSRLGVRTGERYRVSALLSAALVASANDACLALALWRDGTEDAFVARMNARAQQLGLHDTRFRNACGHDAAGHVSTAADLLRLAQAAMAREAVAREVRRVDAEIATADSARRTRVTNRNALVGRYPGAIGVKSGFTSKAGKCVIALARRRGVDAWVVLLDARDRWWDAHSLLDRAFEWHDRRAAAPSRP